VATDRDLLNDLVIMLDLPRFGEVIAHVAAAFAEMRGIEEPDFDGQEMRELAISTWRHVCFMADREQFKASVGKDLEALTASQGPQHRPEFGFFDPPL
jgi:hypothetical protein